LKPITKDDVIKVRLFRFNPDLDEIPYYESYEVPRIPRMRVLDVLDYVQETLSQDVGFRWFCGSKKCGCCAVTVNGKPKLACWEKAESEMTIEPLDNHEIIRDLVIDREAYHRQLQALSPLISRRKEYEGYPETLDVNELSASKQLRECIQCLACHAVCPVVAQKDSGFGGPTLLVALAELALDPRDGEDRATLAADQVKVFKCVSCYKCEEVCPTNIQIVSKAIEPLKRLAYQRRQGKAAEYAHEFLEVVKEYGRANPSQLALRTSGVTIENLKLGLRLNSLGKVKLMDAFIKRKPPGAKAIRRIYESNEE